MSSRTIYKVTKFDLLHLPCVKGNMYAVTDARLLYEDVSNSSRKLFNCYFIDTELTRTYKTDMELGAYYYIWETNSLWLYNINGWTIIIGNSTDAVSGVYYGASGSLEDIYTDVLDNNGLLGDGSVVIRDYNRIIKGKAYIDSTDNYLVFASFLGGGIRFLPYGSESIKGSLSIDKDSLSYNGKVDIYDDLYVHKGNSKYKAWTTEDFTYDNLAEKFHLTVDDIYTNLLNYKTQPLEFNVLKLNGHESDYFATSDHIHNISEIEGTQDYVRSEIESAFDIESTNQNKLGIEITKVIDKDNNPHYQFRANDFNVNFAGDVLGSFTIYNLSSPKGNINLEVVDDSHNHHLRSYTDSNGVVHQPTISDWEVIEAEINNKINDRLTIKKFESYLTTVSGSPDYAGKILLLNSAGNLDVNITGDAYGNANTASKLKTARTVTFKDGVTGTYTYDGSTDSEVTITVDPERHDHWRHPLLNQIGAKSTIDFDKSIYDEVNKTSNMRNIGIAPLDTNGKVPIEFLPDDVLGTLQFQSSFDPSKGVPSDNPKKGQYWVAVGSGVIAGQEYLSGDWIIYDGSNWIYLDNSGCVESVNNQQGRVVILPTNIGSPSYSDIYNANTSLSKVIISTHDGDISYSETNVPGSNKLVKTIGPVSGYPINDEYFKGYALPINITGISKATVRLFTNINMKVSTISTAESTSNVEMLTSTVSLNTDTTNNLVLNGKVVYVDNGRIA